MALYIVSGNRYFITNASSQTVMEASSGNEHPVLGCRRHGGENQQWVITFVGRGWHIRSVSCGKYLQYDCFQKDGVRLIATISPFVWHIWPDSKEPMAGKIGVPNTNFYADLCTHGHASHNTKIQIWGQQDGKNQVWFFDRVLDGDGYQSDKTGS